MFIIENILFLALTVIDSFLVKLCNCELRCTYLQANNNRRINPPPCNKYAKEYAKQSV